MLSPEAEYVCETCGEHIVIPIDPSGGTHQQYVEDCPVCCSANLITVTIDEQGQAWATGQSE